MAEAGPARVARALASLNRTLGPTARVAVAASGGLDSTVLLQAAVHALGAPRVLALHVNHHLQDCAADFERQVISQAGALGIPCEVGHAYGAPAAGQSVEAWARDERYRLLEALARQHACTALLTAHHEDDQAETVLLRLFRGAGLAGLAAMPASRALGSSGSVQLLRPLLEVPRAALLAYAQAHALSWVNDPSNESTRFARNAVRQGVLPAIEQPFPAARTTIARAAAHLAQADRLLNHYVAADLASHVHRVSERPLISVWAWQPLSGVADDVNEARRAALARAWIAQLGVRPMSEARIAELVELTRSQPGHEPTGSVYGELEHEGMLFIRYRQQLIVAQDGRAMMTRLGAHAANRSQNAGEPAEVIAIGQPPADFPSEVVALRDYPGGGTPVRSQAMPHASTLKDAMQAVGLPHWLRPALPVGVNAQGDVCWYPGQQPARALTHWRWACEQLNASAAAPAHRALPEVLLTAWFLKAISQ